MALKSFRQMRSERFYAKHFRRVMSAEEKIHTEFFGGNGGPVLCFPLPLMVLESIAETQPQLQPDLLRLSAIERIDFLGGICNANKIDNRVAPEVIGIAGADSRE